MADLAFGDGLFVEVTDYGGIYTGTNRFEWTRRNSGTTADLRSVVRFNSRWVVAGEGGTILWSDDAVDFVAATVTPATDNWFEGVAASSQIAVAVGDNGAMYSSADGKSWGRVANPPTTNWLRGVTFGGGVFVVVGEAGFVATSPNGIYWQQRASGTTAALNRVAYGNNEFVVVGDGGVALTSVNGGVDWKASNTGTRSDLYSVVWGPGEMLAVGAGEILRRKGIGGAWEDQLSADVAPLPAPVWTYQSAVWDGERYLVAGRTGVAVEGLPESGGLLWFSEDESPRHWLWGVASFPGLFVAVGDRATLLTSPDGRFWDLEYAPVPVTSVTFFGVGGSTNLALAVGSGGTILASQGGLTNVVVTNVIDGVEVVTTNQVDRLGVFWDRVSGVPTTVDLQAVTHDGTRYLVVGSAGTVLTSTNGTAWALERVPESVVLTSVLSFDGNYLASGARGALFRSADGKGWSRIATGTTNWVYRLATDGRQVLAMGQNGFLMVSTNLSEWQSVDTGTTSWLTGAIRRGGDWLMCGTQGTLLRSTDGTTWTPEPRLTGKSFYGMAARAGTAVAVGVEGVILRNRQAGSVRIAKYDHQPGGAATVDDLRIEGPPGEWVVIQSSADFRSWVDEASFLLDEAGEGRFSKEGAWSSPRFFRIVAPEGRLP